MSSGTLYAVAGFGSSEMPEGHVESYPATPAGYGLRISSDPESRLGGIEGKWAAKKDSNGGVKQTRSLFCS